MPSYSPSLYLKRRIDGSYQLFVSFPMPKGFELTAFKILSPEFRKQPCLARELVFALSRTNHTTQAAPVDLCIPIDADWQDSKNEVKVTIIELTRPDDRPLAESIVSLGALEEVREIDESRRGSWWSQRWNQPRDRSVSEKRKPKPLYIDHDQW